MADFDLTYEFVRAAFKVGHADAVGIGMTAGSYWDGPSQGKGGVTVGRLRERLRDANHYPWCAALLDILTPFDDDYRLGRFRALHTPWSAGQLLPKQGWVEGLAKLACSDSPEAAVGVARDMQKRLDGHGGEEGYLLGQIMHLVHPRWFAVVNKGTADFWNQLGYDDGGVKNLESISRDFRRDDEGGTDFDAIDQLVAIPFREVCEREEEDDGE